MPLRGFWRLLAVFLLWLGGIVAVVAGGEALTKAPLRILVGFTAGGTTDLAARLLADNLKGSIGQATGFRGD